MKWTILLAILFVGSRASAADWEGTVTLIRASTVSNAVLFQLSDKLDSPARCNEQRMYAIDIGAPGGDVMFELIKQAYLNRLPVDANSLGTCAVYWKAEGVKDVTLK